MKNSLRLDGVTCTFAARAGNADYTAVADVSLDVLEGEFVAVVGPTGCGKSTLLNVAAGLLVPTGGSVTVFGEKLRDINARAGYLFQNEALMPWRTALQNVTAGLEFRGVAAEQARSSAADWLKRVGLAAHGTSIRTSFPAA